MPQNMKSVPATDAASGESDREERFFELSGKLGEGGFVEGCVGCDCNGVD